MSSISLNAGRISGHWSTEWVLCFKSADELKKAIEAADEYPDGYFDELYKIATDSVKSKSKKQPTADGNDS